MNPDYLPFALCLVAFAAGSIPFGFLAGRLYKVDLRAEGSGNIGATNALRLLGKKAGAAVLALDMLKGVLPTLAAQRLPLSPEWVVGVGLCAVLGHIYSPWVRFKGGKGVATSTGVLAAPLPARVRHHAADLPSPGSLFRGSASPWVRWREPSARRRFSGSGLMFLAPMRSS